MCINFREGELDETIILDSLCKKCQIKADKIMILNKTDSIFEIPIESYGLCRKCIKKIPMEKDEW